jgi:hypothetical protein
MTYKIGSEQITGTISNTITISGLKATVNIPLAPTGTTERKIYRTAANGTVLKLLTTISNNSDLTYLDNSLDGALGADIGQTNNECPKPYFITTAYERLVGCVLSDYPTSVFISDSGVEMWNGAVFNDVSNIDGDNTPIKGMARDYNKAIIGSEKNIYILDASETTPTITASRSNVGVRDGYTMATVPTDNDFVGGVFFVSTLNDVRLFNGNFSQPVATSLDNLRTDNWSEEIQNTFIQESKTTNIFASIFHGYKYHLAMDSSLYIFDIRLQAWSYYKIATASYQLNVNCFSVIDDKLYSGQKNNSIIEEWYLNKQYRGEDPIVMFSSPQLLYSDKYKWFDSLDIIFALGQNNKWQLNIITDGDYNNKIVVNANFSGASFFSGDFDPGDFSASENMEDFRVVYIKRFARFIQFEIIANEEFFYFKGFKLNYSDVNNKEALVG